MGENKQLNSEKFNENYKILKDTSEWLSRQEDPDIDGLIPKVEKAMQAYKICKNRIEKAKLALEKYISDPEYQQPDILKKSKDKNEVELPF